MQRTEVLVTGVEVTCDSQQRTKSLSDIQFCKRFDFKLIFFILRFLFFNGFRIEGSYLQSFFSSSLALISELFSVGGKTGEFNRGAKSNQVGF